MDSPISSPELSVVVATHDNLDMLRRCLDGWRTHASGAPVELIVIADGCSDGTEGYLREQSATEWGRRHLRWIATPDVHELMCTNLGLAEARAPLAMSWHDDMFLQAGWFVPELLATFREIPELGLLCLSRGLDFTPTDEPLRTWHDTIDWKRVQSTIGPAPLNWLRIYEVDAVVRPWVVRTECIAKVGALDEEFRPTEWDEADLCFRIRQAGWKIGAHGYERDRAYRHAVSSTLSRTPSEKRMALGLRNAKIFFHRWEEQIRREHPRARTSWRRRATARGWMAALRQAARHAVGRGQAE